MTFATIYSNALNLLNLPAGTTFYTQAEALVQVQRLYNQLYVDLMDNDDDYFCTTLYVPNTAFTADAQRTFTYLYPLPTDYMRLRMLQYQGQGLGTQSTYFPVYKMTLEEFGNTQNIPAYRIVGSNIQIYDPVGYSYYAVWYYPAPMTWTLSTNMAFPNNFIQDWLTYKLAAEIRMKQHEDAKLWIDTAHEIRNANIRQQSRDDAKALSPKNIFGEGYDPWY